MYNRTRFNIRHAAKNFNHTTFSVAKATILDIYDVTYLDGTRINMAF